MLQLELSLLEASFIPMLHSDRSPSSSFSTKLSGHLQTIFSKTMSLLC